MPDVFTKAKRSAVMARIRGSGNKDTELRMIALLRTNGITGWRRRVTLVGKPDFVFRQQRLAVFVDGCFWHRHPQCKFSYIPKSRLDFWIPKFERNVRRDRFVTRTLERAGWKVIRIWECGLSKKRQHYALCKIQRALAKPSRSRRKKESA